MPEEILETPQPTQPTESKSTDWTKIILAAVLGLGLLAGSAYAGYYYGTQQVQQPEKPTPAVSQPTTKPTPALTPAVEDKTSSWEVFTNSEYNYQFEYPKDWTVGPEPKALHSEILSSRSVYHPSDPTTSFVVAVRTVPLDAYVSAMEAYAVESTTTIVVGGIEGKKIVQEGAEGKQHIIGVYLEFNNLTYGLSGYMKNETSVKENFVPIFNQILSTFKFID